MNLLSSGNTGRIFRRDSYNGHFRVYIQGGIVQCLQKRARDAVSAKNYVRLSGNTQNKRYLTD
jgi:hypothetical protein